MCDGTTFKGIVLKKKLYRKLFMKNIKWYTKTIIKDGYNGTKNGSLASGKLSKGKGKRGEEEGKGKLIE